MPVVKSRSLVISPWTSCCSPGPGSQISRSTFGSCPKSLTTPVPHQSSRRSKIICVGAADTTCQGLVVTGQPFARSKCVKVVQSWPSKMCFGTMCRPMSYLYDSMW